jgi:hypothetical protein
MDGWRVAKEVQIQRCGSVLADQCDGLAHLFDTQQCTRQRTQTARLRDSDGQLGIAGTRHRRLNDGNIDSDQAMSSFVLADVECANSIGLPWPLRTRQRGDGLHQTPAVEPPSTGITVPVTNPDPVR